MKRIAPMAALVAAALAFSTSPPALATSLTAPQLALELTADLTSGDVGRARHKLHLLHNLGVLTLGRSDLNVESLIDLLIRGHADVVVARLAGAEKYVFCDHWASKVNLAAPAALEAFPVSSAGCPA